MANIGLDRFTGADPTRPTVQQDVDATVQELVDEGYSAETARIAAQVASMPLGTEAAADDTLGRFYPERNQTGFGEIEEPYKKDDAGRILQNMSLEQRLRVQERLETAGFRVGEPGVADVTTEKGFKDLLRMSNERGMRWELQLQRMVKSKVDAQELLEEREEPETETFNTQVALIPDLDRLKLEVEGQFRDALDRDPTQAELRLFSNKLMEGFEEAAVANNRPGPEYEVEEGENAGRVIARERKDPRAEFLREFKKRYGGSIERLEDRQETEEVRQQVQRGIERGP